MSPRDAFGNEIDDDAHGPAPTPAPAPAPAPIAADPMAGAPVAAPQLSGSPSPRRSFPVKVILAFLVFDAVVAAVVIVAVSISNQASDIAKVPELTRQLREAVRARAALPPVSPSRSAAAPRGLRAGSMLRPAAVRTALKQAGDGRLRILRLAPASADLQLVTASGRLRLVHLSDGVRNVVSASSGAGGLATIPRGRVDPSAPSRLVRAAARRLHRSTSGIDYVVGFAFDDRLQWSAYFRGGTAATGDAHGRFLRRIS